MSGPVRARWRRASMLSVAALIVGGTWATTAASASPAAPSKSVATSKPHLFTVNPAHAAGFPAGSAMGRPYRGAQNPEFPGALGPDGAHPARRPPVDRSLSPRPNAAQVQARLAQPGAVLAPTITPTAVSSAHSGLSNSTEGLNLFDQRYANNGNQFSVEPPDQALCVGGGYELEATNDVLQVYNSALQPASPVVDLNTFYGYPAQYNRTTGIEGPFVTDPTCIFDAGSQRFYVLVLTLEVDPTTGALLGPNHLDLAVSKTANPLNGFIYYSIPAQDDGTQGTVSDPGCPCIGDYPHIGSDANGIYLTTNEYPLSSDPGRYGNNFNGAQIYALSKSRLAAGQSLTGAHFVSPELPGGIPGFTVWPAQVSATDYDQSNGGTEHFLSSVAAEEALGNGYASSIGVWAITNTQSLNSGVTALTLQSTSLASETYGVPPLSSQKVGPTPLKDCINTGCLPGVGPEGYPPEVESPLDSNDSRMQQVWYANGLLFAGLDTIGVVGQNVQAAIAYFGVRPTSSVTTSQMAGQGYLGVANNNVTYPAVAVDTTGHGVMAFTLVGQSFYPTAAYSLFNSGRLSQVQVASLGAAPQDGFTGYRFYGNPPRPRWGDYGAADVANGHLWIASEYIAHSCTFTQYEADPTCGGTRAVLGNWSTRISQIH